MYPMKRQLKTKKKLSSTSDRISCLPEEIIEKILTHIPIQEAVRTCILSRKWRFIWRQMPEIIIDDSFCKNLTSDNEDELFMNIRNIILLHTGSIIKFNLSLYRLQSPCYVDRIINYSILKSGVKNFSYSSYQLSLCFFSYEQLEHVSISICLVQPPLGFKGFGKLLSLELHLVRISAESCSSIISSCPLLERLILDCLFLSDQLDIDAVNLRVFQYAGSLPSIHFKSTPRLESLSMFLDNYGVRVEKVPVVLYDGLPALQFLELGSLSLKYMVVALMDGAWNRPAHELHHLKVLKLNDISINYEEEVSPVFSLVRSSRKLEKLIIRLRNNCPQEPCENFDVSDISFNHLTEVHIENITGTKQELVFIEYLLGNASKLLNMVIVVDTYVSSKLEFVAKVTQFHCESRLAQITFKDFKDVLR